MYLLLRTSRLGWDHLPADHLPKRVEIAKIADQTGLAVQGTYKDIHSMGRLLSRTFDRI